MTANDPRTIEEVNKDFVNNVKFNAYIDRLYNKGVPVDQLEGFVSFFESKMPPEVQKAAMAKYLKADNFFTRVGIEHNGQSYPNPFTTEYLDELERSQWTPEQVAQLVNA